MSKGWQVVGAFIVVFLAGAAFGVVFTLRYAVDHLPLVEQARKPVQPPPTDFNVQVLRRWVQMGQLKLTPQQKERILPIVNEAGEDYQRLVRENQHSALLIIEHMQDEVEALLNPDQKLRFDQLRAQLRARVQFWQQQQRRRFREQVQKQMENDAAD